MSHSSIVVQEFTFNPNSSPDGVLLEITGRTAGPIGFIFDQLKMGTISTLSIREGEVRFRFNNLAGTEIIMCPFNAIRCAEAGVSKPMWSLFAGAALVPLGLGLLTSGPFFGLVLVLIGIGLIANYYITKELYITFSTGSMTDTQGLAFSQGLVNGKNITLETILEAIDHINDHLIRVTETTGKPPARGTGESARFAPPVPEAPQRPSPAPEPSDAFNFNTGILNPAHLPADAQNENEAQRAFQAGQALVSRFRSGGESDYTLLNQALAEFQQATKLDPDNAEYWKGIGKVASKLELPNLITLARENIDRIRAMS